MCVYAAGGLAIVVDDAMQTKIQRWQKHLKSNLNEDPSRGEEMQIWISAQTKNNSA